MTCVRLNFTESNSFKSICMDSRHGFKAFDRKQFAALSTEHMGECTGRLRQRCGRRPPRPAPGARAAAAAAACSCAAHAPASPPRDRPPHCIAMLSLFVNSIIRIVAEPGHRNERSI